MARCDGIQRPISIPEPVNKVDSLWRTSQALKEAVEVIQGIRGNREYALRCQLQNLEDVVSALGAARTNAVGVVTVTTTTYTAGAATVILVDDDTAGGAVTITLPTAVGRKGIQYIVKKLGTTATVTVDADGSELIDGDLTAVIPTQYESATLVSDDLNWAVI